MKKYIYTFIVVILCMSFTTYNIKTSNKLINAIDNLEYMRSYIAEDVNRGAMETEIGEIYIDIIDDIEYDIIAVIKENDKALSKD
jgi:hypothetical protein